MAHERGGTVEPGYVADLGYDLRAGRVGHPRYGEHGGLGAVGQPADGGLGLRALPVGEARLPDGRPSPLSLRTARTWSGSTAAAE